MSTTSESTSSIITRSSSLNSEGNGSALDVSDSESDETPFSNQRVPYITQNISARKNDKCGYLHKQGGVKANKGWRKRWVVFNGQDLRYYVNNKSQISKRIIPVSCMTDVMSDIKNEDTSRFRFRLITTIKDRVFHFSADDLDDCLTWTQTLMAAIQKYSNSSDEDISSQKADKEGYIRFDDDGGRKYFVAITDNRLCYYQNKDEYLLHSPIHEIMMELASVKDGKTPGKLQLSTHYGRFMLSFDTSSECQQWKMAMEDAIAKGLSDDSILEKVYENESNRICADCEAENPHWASINLGIVVCKKCAGIHRMFDVSVSKIRSLRMDTRVWTPSLVELMKSIGNANANNFWESEMEPDEKIEKNASTEERKEFIQTKYRVKKFCGFHSAHRNKNILNEELLKSAASDNVLNTMHIVFSGADVLYHGHGDTDTPYIVAKKAGERLQVEFLYQNFADESTLASEANDDNRVREDVRHQGYLLKTGPNMKGFDRRWCVLEHGAFTYYDSEKSTTAKDSVDRQFIYCVRCTYAERQSSAFEVSTSKGNQRSYLLAADGDGDRMLWMQALSKLICPVSVMEHVGMMEFTFAGNFYLKDSVVEDWRKTWIMLNGRDLFYYTKEQRLESVDLRKASSIKHQSAESCCTKSDEVGYNFVVNTPDRALYIQADLAKDTEKLRNAIETAVKSSGYSLEEQQLTSDNVPVIIDRCISHVTNEGLKTKGIYRESATQSRVLALLEELKKDPRSVRLELYTDHEVANALKKFVRELRTSVFTKDYTQWMNTAAINDVNSKIAWYKYLLDKMSDTHYNTLRKLVLHFNRILKYKSENQMTVENLATCFAPSLFVPENPEQLSFNVHSSLPSQLSVLVDIIAYHDQLFRLDETNTIEDEIEKAKERLKKLSTCSVRSSEPSNSLLISVSMFDISGQCELVNVNSIKTSGEIVDYLQSKRNIASHSLNIHELLLNGQLERPIHCQDCVFNDVIRWGDWPEDVRTGALLCLKPALLIEKIASYHDPSKYLLAELKCSEKKNFKKFTFDFKQSKFSCYKDSKATNCLWSFNAEEMIIYVGVDPRRSGIPSKFGFTFIMKGEKPTTKNVFGRSVCFQTEAELYTWLAALYMAKYTEGLVPL